MRSYEHIIEEEVVREIATWPEGQEFETLPPMMRITLNVILRAVFGAEGAALDELRGMVPRHGHTWLACCVVPPIMRRDLGPWSPGGRLYAEAAPVRRRHRLAHRRCAGRSGLEERNDVLALLLQARYENGEPISDRHIADELLTLVASGHETTASRWHGRWSGCAGIRNCCRG